MVVIVPGIEGVTPTAVGTGDLAAGSGDVVNPKEVCAVKISWRCVVLSPTPLTRTLGVADGFRGEVPEDATVIQSNHNE